LIADVSDHLGQLYESQGKKQEALAAYVLAQAAFTRDELPDTRGRIQESIRRLSAEGLKPGFSSPREALQGLRTFKIPRPQGAGGWGAFRLEITPAGVIQSQKMSGENKIALVAPALNKMKLPELLPPDSKAHLLRSAVVSCTSGDTCDVVMVPDGGLQTEQ
jgi:hypothetical protein